MKAFHLVSLNISLELTLLHFDFKLSPSAFLSLPSPVSLTSFLSPVSLLFLFAAWSLSICSRVGVGVGSAFCGSHSCMSVYILMTPNYITFTCATRFPTWFSHKYMNQVTVLTPFNITFLSHTTPSPLQRCLPK